MLSGLSCTELILKQCQMKIINDNYEFRFELIFQEISAPIYENPSDNKPHATYENN